MSASARRRRGDEIICLAVAFVLLAGARADTSVAERLQRVTGGDDGRAPTGRSLAESQHMSSLTPALGGKKPVNISAECEPLHTCGTRHCVGAECPERCRMDCECPAETPRCQRNPRTGVSRCLVRGVLPLLPLFFVHIPKTAGTTFRFGVQSMFGAERMCFDYGGDSDETSAIVKEHMYMPDTGAAKANLTALAGAVVASSCRFLSGHLPAVRYMRVFGLRNTVSIVRHPLERIVSEFHHKERKGEAVDDMATFLQSRAGTQLSCLNQVDIPIQAYGFIGLTERYEETLAMLNDAYTLNIPGLALNVYESKDKYNSSQLADAVAMPPVHAAEMRMYAQAVAFFDERKRMSDACKPFAHGAVDGAFDSVVRGWAWWAHSNDMVEVSFFADNVLLGIANASIYHRLALWRAPRNGMVGFAFQLPSWFSSSVVRCVVSKTEQVLGELKVEVPQREI